jgi:hypothetical protein
MFPVRCVTYVPGLYLAGLAPRPLSVNVDMTSTVKYRDDARTGRAVASLGPAPDSVDAGVIGSGAMGALPRVDRPPGRDYHHTEEAKEMGRAFNSKQDPDPDKFYK